MPYTHIILHAVWATKGRKPLLNKENKDRLCQHIRGYAQGKQIHLLNVNGWKNHLHGLVSLSADQNVLTIMQLIKGASSHWANRNLRLPGRFGWQDEYFAVSVSRSHLGVVSRYIDQQETHHRTKTFQEEYEEFMQKYSFGVKG